MKNKRKLSLPAWIFIGMFAGILAGLCFLGNPEFTKEWIKPIGTIYINLLKFLVVPVVLFSIADGVISLKDLKRVGSVGLKTFVYYMCTTALAVVIGLALATAFKGLFPPLDSVSLGELAYEAKESPGVMQVIVNIFPDNLFKPMVNADMLPVIVIAILLGAGVLAAGDKGRKIGDAINCMNEVVMKIMMMIIKITPLGVFCLMTNVVAENGPKIVGTLALVIAVAVQTSMIGYGIHAGQRPNLGQTLGIGLAMAGLVVLLLPGLEAPPLPAACVMFVSGSAWGAYSLCGRKFRHAAEATTDNFIRCVPLVLVLMLALWWRLSLPVQGVALALCAGALASALGYILWYALVPCYSIAAAAAAQLSVPVITALGAVVFVGEAITLRLVLCSAAILGGIFIVALWGQRHAVPRPDGNRCGQSADTAPRR